MGAEMDVDPEEIDTDNEHQQDEAEVDLYEVLGVKKDAAAKEIKKAYYKLVG